MTVQEYSHPYAEHPQQDRNSCLRLQNLQDTLMGAMRVFDSIRRALQIVVWMQRSVMGGVAVFVSQVYGGGLCFLVATH